MTNLCLVVQEEKLKRPLSHMQAWEIAHTRKDPKPGEPKYYGKKTAGRKKAYSEGYLKLHPDTPDPIAADLDERVVVGMGPKEHGREAVLDAVITPTISYTQLRRIDPSLSQRTSQPVSSSQSLFQEQQSVSIFPLIFIAHFYFPHLVVFMSSIMSYRRPTWSTHARRPWRGIRGFMNTKCRGIARCSRLFRIRRPAGVLSSLQHNALQHNQC